MGEYYKQMLSDYSDAIEGQEVADEEIANLGGMGATDDDIVVKPSHYERYAIEPINFIMLNDMEFWRGNIVKYVARAGFKAYPNQTEVQSEITDLRKVIRYSEMRINQLQGRDPNAV